MPGSTHGSSTYSGLVELGRRLYEQSLVRREDEYITDPRGQPIGWLLDTRMPMLEAEMFQEAGQVLASRLRSKDLHQVAGFGFGSYALVCSVLAVDGTPPFRGGFIREQRKPHGRRRLVEGPLDRHQPVVLLDDIINSGRSANRALSLLRSDGYDVVGLMTLFNFTWSGGRELIEREGLWVDAMLDLNLRDRGKSSSDSA
ncbi:MAG: orotate phosphoribosyltransferase [Bacteroidetes bacterium]|nr:orotate phosphoribosyltransferase [Bacteroidota bacterium]